jgi:hypothetical protein
MNMPTRKEIDDWHEECAVGARRPESSIGFWPFEVGGDDLAEIAVAALSRWGNPTTPPAPEPGEVARFTAWLQEHAGQCAELGRPDWAHMAARAATLLEQQQHWLGLADKELDAFIEQQAAPPVVVPVPVAELVGEHRVRWFFYSGFEKVSNHTQVYFAGTFSTDLADPRAYVDKAMELVAKDRNCSIDVLCLTALTPLEVSK